MPRRSRSRASVTLLSGLGHCSAIRVVRRQRTNRSEHENSPSEGGETERRRCNCRYLLHRLARSHAPPEIPEQLLGCLGAGCLFTFEDELQVDRRIEEPLFALDRIGHVQFGGDRQPKQSVARQVGLDRLITIRRDVDFRHQWRGCSMK